VLLLKARQLRGELALPVLDQLDTLRRSLRSAGTRRATMRQPRGLGKDS